MDDALPRIAADIAGHAGVGQGRAPVEDAAQVVPAHGLDDRVHVAPGGKAWAEGHGDGRHIAASAQVALGQDGVHDHRRAQRADAVAGLVHKERHLAGLPGVRQVGLTVHAAADHALDLGGPVIDRLGQGSPAADGRGPGALGDGHVQAAVGQPHDGPGRKVARAAHNHKAGHGRITLPAPASVSAMAYMLVTCPTASLSVRP